MSEMRTSETVLDVKGMSCPLPVLRANRALRQMQPGERLRVLATDRAAVADFRAFCRETGHALLAFSEHGEFFTFVIRRRAEPQAPERNVVERNVGERNVGEPEVGESKVKESGA